MIVIRSALIIATVMTLAACGSATPVLRSDGSGAHRLADYTRAVVVPLADATRLDTAEDGEPTSAMDASELEFYRREVTVAGRAFADAMAEELRQRREFRQVVVGEVAQPGDLVIGGEVTVLVTGNFAMRWVLGIVGAGRAIFEATVRLSDAASGEELGTLRAEARSSRWGGTFAAIQGAEVLARDAASKAAVEVGKARRAER